MVGWESNVIFPPFASLFTRRIHKRLQRRGHAIAEWLIQQNDREYQYALDDTHVESITVRNDGYRVLQNHGVKQHDPDQHGSVDQCALQNQRQQLKSHHKVGE